MAHVSGPVSTLPGAISPAPKNTTCDDCDRPAFKRVQGETDSFGAEYFDLCKEHYKQYTEGDAPVGICDWCKADNELKPIRDPDEGQAGPVYYVCDSCRTNFYDNMSEE